MNKRELSEELIDLGVASVETKGDGDIPVDPQGLQAKFGLSDD